jgi:hypothetical protein
MKSAMKSATTSEMTGAMNQMPRKSLHCRSAKIQRKYEPEERT